MYLQNKQEVFGNIISIDVYEDDIDIDKINDIQKIDFDIKDKNGNKIKVISRTENITLGDYQNDGKYHKLGLEVQLTVDDIENKGYSIKMFESDKIKVTQKRVMEAHNQLIENLANPNIQEHEETQETEETEETERKDFDTVYVFKFDAEKSDAQNCEPYILLWEKGLLFAKGENVEAESTYCFANYKINSDKSITLSNIKTQDNAFFNAADVYLDTIDGNKYIVFSDGYSVVSYKFVKSYEVR